MKRQMNQTILENGVYGLLWAVVLVVPLFGYHDGSGIRWCGVFRFWLGVLPLRCFSRFIITFWCRCC